LALLIGLLFDPEDEGKMFHRNNGSQSADYMMLYPRILRKLRCENLKYYKRDMDYGLCMALVTSAEYPRQYGIATLPLRLKLQLVYFHAGDTNLSGAVSALETKELGYELRRPLHRFSEPVNHIKTAPVLGGSRRRRQGEVTSRIEGVTYTSTK
jgi:hypothetical protein